MIDISSYYNGRSRNITDLRNSSKAALSLPDFNNVVWIGVFGSFSRNQQNDRSDVDIVVVEHSDAGESQTNDTNDDPWTIEDLLPRVWCRPVEIVSLENDLHELVDIDSLLTSRTIYGDEKCEEVLKLRQNARRCLDEGLGIFHKTGEDMQSLKSKILNVKDFIEFMKDPPLQQSSRDELLRILDTFGTYPTSHPIYEGFYSAIIYPANEIKQMVTSSAGEDEEYWRTIWEVLSSSSPRSLQSLLMRLKKFVLPTLYDMEKRIKLSGMLEDEARMTVVTENGLTAPAAVGGEEKPTKYKAKGNVPVIKERTIKRVWGRLRSRVPSRVR